MSSSLFRISRPSLARLRWVPRAPVFSTSAAPLPAAPDRDIGQFLKAVTGILASGSAVGVWYWTGSASNNSTVGPADDDVDDDAGVEYGLDAKKTRFLFGDDYRRRVFFNYEKRIRLRSPPEKVFEYFASYRAPEGESYMTPADLMRAVVPVFPPSESNRIREGFLKGERRQGELWCPPSSFFMLFDTNNDGLISFKEYIFFVTLLSIPESSFSVAFKMFDVDGNGEIEKEEFKKVMALMQSYTRQGASQRDGALVRLGFAKSTVNHGLVDYLFGKDGTGRLHHDKFVEFLKGLHDEILQLEFSHYDCKSRGAISAKDFALSMVASADIKHVGKLLDRVDALDSDPQLRDMTISLEEFKTFAELRGVLKQLSLAIFSHGKASGLLTKPDFQRAASQVCGISLSDNVVDVVFHVFDANQDGSLGSEEFISALQRRESDIRQPTTTGFVGLMSCWLNCAKCSFAGQFLES